jgi:3'-phosphoadenosine 5'-phosphosulfate sulfotransferase (PAPS reductase)/FAD synthetase
MTNVIDDVFDVVISPDNLFIETENNLLNYLQSSPEDYYFQFNFSGGKDSSCIVGLLLSLINRGLVNDSIRNRIIIYHSDTTIETPVFTEFTKKVLIFFKSKGLKVVIGRAKIEQRLFAQIFGYGKPIPNHSIRWCTDNLKIKLAEKLAKKFSKNTIIITGEHIGESIKRDNKLNGCGSSECGSDTFKNKSSNNTNQIIYRAIHNWRSCQVWDYLQYLGYSGIIDFYEEISKVYKIANDLDSNKSLRMGCVGCPVISIKNHYHTEDKGIPNKLSLKLSLIFEEMRNDSIRLRNPRRYFKDNYSELNGGMGAIALIARNYYWEEMKKLNQEMKNIGFDMISDAECEFIEKSLVIGQYPVTYHKNTDTIPKLEQEWESRKPTWLK